MARQPGRNGALYINLTSSGTPEPVTFITKFSIAFSTDKYDVTAMNDANKIYTAGLPDAQGDFTGWYDDVTVQMYTAAIDGIARKCYIYPNRSATPGQYFWGTALFDFKFEAPVDGPIAISGSFAAASGMLKVG